MNVALAQWLAGGLPAAFHELYPFMILAAASVHPPRRFFPFLAILLAVAIVPELGRSSGNEIGDLVTELLLWIGASSLVVAVMWKLRHQRAEREESHAEAQELARVDPLTRLGNRRAFEERVANEIARSRRGESPLSLLVCDLDRFKAINDEYGHLAGDDCLRQVASALGDDLRGADLCFRWGGDEFVVLLDDPKDDGGAAVCSRIASLLTSPVPTRSGQLVISASCGSVRARPGETPDELFDRADRRMYRHKRARMPRPRGWSTWEGETTDPEGQTQALRSLAERLTRVGREDDRPPSP
jgi:diguanylate cyclase (GGDEF)-like protein